MLPQPGKAVLHDIFGFVRVAKQTQGLAIKRTAVARHQRGKRPHRAGTHCGHERRVVGAVKIVSGSVFGLGKTGSRWHSDWPIGRALHGWTVAAGRLTDCFVAQEAELQPPCKL